MQYQKTEKQGKRGMTSMVKHTSIVIMAGGKGERMRPFSDVLPKPLLTYHGKTLVENVIQQFYERGFRKFYFVLCNRGKLISTYLSSLKLDCEMHFVYEDFPMGTIGGLWLLRDELRDDFILCNCDNLGDFDYQQAILFHRTEQAAITMFVKKESHVIPFGLVKTDGKTRVCSVDEKPVLNSFISTGAYVMKASVIRRFLCGKRMDMPALINYITKEEKVCFVEVGDKQWIDMSLNIFNAN